MEEQVVRSIVGFVASIDLETPYSLPAFYPQFYMEDMPLTPGSLDRRCIEAAGKEGLRNTGLGNVHLLSPG